MTFDARLPSGIGSLAVRGPAWAAWVAELPALRDALTEEWSLRVDGPAWLGNVAVVWRVVTADGVPAALKIGFVHPEAAQEHLALRHWAGAGAVELVRADPRRGALVMELLGPRSLDDVPALEACERVGALYGRLHVPAPPSVRPLTEPVAEAVEALARTGAAAPIPRRLVEQAVSWGGDLLTDPASTGMLIHTDLHGGNVLEGSREPWLAIDPKPLSGDPHYEPAPLLWNRFDEVAGDVRAGVRQRFHTLVDLAGLDEDRARAWVVVRMMVNAHQAWRDVGSLRAMSSQTRAWITRAISVAKAVQD